MAERLFLFHQSGEARRKLPVEEESDHDIAEEEEEPEREGHDTGEPERQRGPEEDRGEARGPDERRAARQPRFAFGPAQERFGVGRWAFGQPPGHLQFVAQIDPRGQLGDRRLPCAHGPWRGKIEQPTTQRRLAPDGAAGIEEVHQRAGPKRSRSPA